jgi:glutathione S-transferase
MYFPWVDNVYSHRSSQKYKRKTLVTRYFDCRMKGRPSGTLKSNDPNKKKRKRDARQLNLCDVKIKITEYPAGSTEELRQTGDSIGLRRSTLEEALARGHDGPYRVMQRISGGGMNGGDDGRAATHKHDLRESDRIKKSTALRHLAEREKEVKRNQKPSLWKPRGEAATTAKNHAKDAGIKLYSACFW